ncbi:SNF2-related protein [Devosia rhodophyticola]|uniref:SNF2-related protein n=1 Tax=Devosia rhodophyticola TaxID=3026423 RepID=A0ABY7YX90_9HYPH|nr:SNF2-related protein [Devosia rhodophyticola]WDR05635.1 SNF2-related protein [Devosia rhodophyticola]
MLPVLFPDGSQAWLPESALEVVPLALPPLDQRFEDGSFADPEWLRRTLARLRVTGRLTNVIYSMEATDTDFYAFQFKPVLKLLNSPRDGLLVADEVGLGKTIEAGLIWTELRARLQSNRLLVICPKTLCQKWRSELHQRFGVDARIVNADELLELVSGSAGANSGFAAIASMQSLRPPRGWSDDETVGQGRRLNPRALLARFLDAAAEETPLLDLLVIDEAHHMRNPETALHALGSLLNSVSSHRVFLSATPIHLRNRDLQSLLRLIDPDTFEYEDTLSELIEVNAPIVQARDLVLKPDTTAADILRRLDEAMRYQLLADSAALRLVRKEIESAELTMSKRAEIASRLEQANQLANYVTRTRRRDVEEFRVRRDVKAPTLTMLPVESVFYHAVTEEVRQYAIENDVSDGFLLSMPQRLLSSSPAAASAYWSSLAAGQISSLVDEDDGSDELDEQDMPSPHIGPLVSRLAFLSSRLGYTQQLRACDSKYTLLLDQLRKVWADDALAKVIVFSTFKHTLGYLQERLTEDFGRDSLELLHGSIREPREVVLQRFKADVNRKVLLSSEVGSEGIDLQFCWLVVNYDLPWNPMRLEQRIGRVDRLGQKQDVVVILNLVFDGTIDQRIYNRLYVRLGLGQKALGEFEAVLGEPIRDMTRKLVNPQLTDAQRIEAIEQAAQALEVLRQQEDALEEQAGALIRHGDYILQSIADSRRMNRWLSGNDVLVYVRDRLHRSFPGSMIEMSPAGSDRYRIKLSTEAVENFSSYLARRGLKGTTRILGGSDQQRYRFEASVARKRDGDAEVISQIHSLVRFAAYLDSTDELQQPQPVAATLRQSDLDFECSTGTFVLGIRRWNASTPEASVVANNRIAYAGAHLETGAALSPEEAEVLASAIANNGRVLPNIASDPRLPAGAALLRMSVLTELDDRFVNFVAQAQAQVSDRVRIRRRALQRHQDAKTLTLVQTRDKHSERATDFEKRGQTKEARQRRSLVEATEGKLRRLHESCRQRLTELEVLDNITPEMSDVAVVMVQII